jgi:hypothetical protein
MLTKLVLKHIQEIFIEIPRHILSNSTVIGDFDSLHFDKSSRQKIDKDNVLRNT